MTAPTLASVAGTAKVVRFNWPKYAGACGLVLAAVLAPSARVGPVVSAAVWLAAVLGCVWSASSLVATWWVYDHSRVYDHVARGLGPVGVWATVHAGFDDATPALVASIGRAPARVVEVSMPARASLRRARTTRTSGRPAAAHELGFATASIDTIFLTFAVHEVRSRSRQQALFVELHRALRSGGRLVITEHLRDLPNAIVFGPGALHFQCADVWRARAAETGFASPSESTITPYVRRLTWNR